jgi:menaquinone-dependent protoporphyrinogen oxidase
MGSKVLVAYATRYGSTEEVAKAIAERLDERGMDVSVEGARAVKSLDGYDGVVLGTALYIGKLLKDSRTFVAKHEAALAKVPVAFFALGPTDPEEGMEEPQQQFDKALGELEGFRPTVTKVFYGAIDPAKFKFPDSLLTKMPASPLKDMDAMDARDWDEIRGWTDTLPGALGLE